MAQLTDRLMNFANFHQAYVTQYIQVADAKAGVVITISGALIGYLMSHAAFAAALSLGSVESWLSLPTIGMLIASFFLAFWVLRPRGGKPRGPIYFSSVARFEDAQAYIQHLAALSDRQLADARLEHCYDISIVADKKFTALRWAMLTGVVGSVGAALSIKLLAL